MITRYMAQLSGPWWEARRGIITASAADRVITGLGNPSKQVEKLINELIAERIDLSPNFFSAHPMTRAMANGRDTEDEARRWYAANYGTVQQVGICATDDMRYACSPDGLVGDDGVLELKCPMMKTHIGYLRDGGLPRTYRPQVHMQLLVTKREWVDFVSYAIGADPLVVRVVPDELTVALAYALADAWERLDAVWLRLCERMGKDPAWPPADSPLREPAGAYIRTPADPPGVAGEVQIDDVPNF